MRYWSGGTSAKTKASGHKTVLIYGVGPPFGYGQRRCHHNARLSLDDVPEWEWYDISAHLGCTERDSIGYVDTRRDSSEVINFNKGICA